MCGWEWCGRCGCVAVVMYGGWLWLVGGSVG